MADLHPPGHTAAARTAAIVAADVVDDRGRAPSGPLTREEHLGAREEPMGLRQGLATGGAATLVWLAASSGLEELQVAVLGVLAPDLARFLHVGDHAMVVLTVATTVLFALGAVPLASLAGRVRRTSLIGWCTLGFAGAAALSGVVSGAAGLFAARVGAGISGLSSVPVANSLLADTYPIGVRGRVAGARAAAARAVAVVGCALVALSVSSLGATDLWRGVSLAVGAMAVVVALGVLRLRGASRGRWEQLDVLGREIDPGDPDDAPMSTEVALAQVAQVRTLRNVVAAFTTIGFVLFPREVLATFELERRFGLDAPARGLVVVVTGVVVVCVLGVAGRMFDRLFRDDPARLTTALAWLLLPLAVLVPLQFAMPDALLFGVVGALGTVSAATGLAMAMPLLQQVLPPRLRTLGSAVGALYIFGVGALGGAVLSVLLAGAFGERTAVSVLTVPAALLGWATLLGSGQAVRQDVAAVVAGVRRAGAAGASVAVRGSDGLEPAETPALAVSELDVGYGPVQVLFDVSFQVRRGETLALLGTNGGGKSTVLRTIAGLLTPTRGSVWLDGRDITWTTPEWRAGAGIQLLPGGHGVFPSMSVAENLEMGAYLLRGDRRRQRSRVEGVLELFPALADRRAQTAGSMSGGQQQQLALARVLLHEPEVLIVDELSLGLAPVVVAELLEVVERLQSERGQTIVVVEQSLDVALSIADRAVFMEKGQVRFEGPAAQLAERHDLVRAVFFGGRRDADQPPRGRADPAPGPSGPT
jgi:ABC-type branched-subunit amino acid transport system ATPase component/predicted MFS family arabinose efflux permease